MCPRHLEPKLALERVARARCDFNVGEGDPAVHLDPYGAADHSHKYQRG